MARTSSKGICAFCKAEFGKSGIARHLATCTAKPPTTGAATPFYHVVVEGRGAPMYWMHLDVPAKATLQTLDQFLRNTWLECCGHMSAFEIGGQHYASYVDPGMGDKSMRVALERVAKPGAALGYEYDFGSTTELYLRVLDTHPNTGKDIRILARNAPPAHACTTCGAPATTLCSECQMNDDAGLYCDTCADKHECDEEMFLPLVNSPRAGVCAYGT